MEVSDASIIRNVMYRNTLKTLTSEASSRKSLYSIYYPWEKAELIRAVTAKRQYPRRNRKKRPGPRPA
jgi:hypothetical protein